MPVVKVDARKPRRSVTTPTLLFRSLAIGSTACCLLFFCLTVAFATLFGVFYARDAERAPTTSSTSFGAVSAASGRTGQAPFDPPEWQGIFLVDRLDVPFEGEMNSVLIEEFADVGHMSYIARTPIVHVHPISDTDLRFTVILPGNGMRSACSVVGKIVSKSNFTLDAQCIEGSAPMTFSMAGDPNCL